MKTQPGITLDFTEIAEPVTIGLVKDWCDRLYEGDLEVGRVILWEHQLDWIVKDAGGEQHCADHLVRGARIWGIPLTIRKKVFGLTVEVPS